jgi:hypothetical protein
MTVSVGKDIYHTGLEKPPHPLPLPLPLLPPSSNISWVLYPLDRIHPHGDEAARSGWKYFKFYLLPILLLGILRKILRDF